MHSEPRSTWLGRLVRGRRPDHNPLRRTVDRVETWVLALLVVAFLAAAPFAAKAGGAWAYAAAHRDQVAQQAGSRHVTAVLLTSVAALAPSGEPASQGEGLAAWTAPDGKAVTGEVPAAPGTPAGTAVRVWSTRDGQVTNPPLQGSDVNALAALGTAAGVIGLAVALTLVALVTRQVLGQRRMAAWDADWRATGPRWTHHRA